MLLDIILSAEPVIFIGKCNLALGVNLADSIVGVRLN
jgi:hypothetical protein